jgi:hypothetical protein
MEKCNCFQMHTSNVYRHTYNGYIHMYIYMYIYIYIYLKYNYLCIYLDKHKHSDNENAKGSRLRYAYNYIRMYFTYLYMTTWIHIYIHTYIHMPSLTSLIYLHIIRFELSTTGAEIARLWTLLRIPTSDREAFQTSFKVFIHIK